MANVLRCDFCKKCESPYSLTEPAVIVHQHMVKRKSLLIKDSWDKLDICEDCLKKFREKVAEKKEAMNG